MSSPHYHVEDYPSDEEDFDSDFYKEIEEIQKQVHTPPAVRQSNLKKEILTLL